MDLREDLEQLILKNEYSHVNFQGLVDYEDEE